MTIDNPVPQSSPVVDWLTASGLAALSAVPGIGGPTAHLIGEAISQAHRGRQEDWMAMVVARLNLLESGGQKIDVQDPSFLSSLARAARAAAETASQEKRQVLARAAAHSGPWSDIEQERREEFVQLACELQPVHIRLLVFLDAPYGMDQVPAEPYVNHLWRWMSHVLNLPLEDLSRVLDALQARGLAQRPGGEVRATYSFGHEFLKFLRG